MQANKTASPAHLPLYLLSYLSQMVRPCQHTFRLSTRQPSKVELDPLSIQVRAHINLMVARGMYAHIFYTVLKWTVTDSQIPAWRGLFLQNNASQTLLCTHIAQGSRFTAALGREPGVSISNTFRWCQGYGPRTILRGYAVHVGRKSAGKSPTMQPPEQGEKEKGNLGVDENSLSQSASQTCLSIAIT